MTDITQVEGKTEMHPKAVEIDNGWSDGDKRRFFYDPSVRGDHLEEGDVVRMMVDQDQTEVLFKITGFGDSFDGGCKYAYGQIVDWNEVVEKYQEQEIPEGEDPESLISDLIDWDYKWMNDDEKAEIMQSI